MTTSAEVLAAVEVAFIGVPKPEHFMEYLGDPECTEHDELLRARDRDTLKIEDVGNIGWQPISYCSPEGMAYYMPALTRLALTEPDYRFGCYSDTLLIHLSNSAIENGFLQFCNREQRLAIAILLDYLSSAFPDYEMIRLAEPDEFKECAEAWRMFSSTPKA